MKQFLILVILLVVAASCIDLGFNEPQPVGVPDIPLFPDELTGIYGNKDDTLVITSSMIISGNDSTSISFSDSLRLRKMDGWYFLNMTDGEMGYWTVVVARRKGKKLIVMLPDINEDDKEAIEEIWEVEEKYNSLENLKAYIIYPQKEEWRKLIKKFYSREVLKKID